MWPFGDSLEKANRNAALEVLDEIVRVEGLLPMPEKSEFLSGFRSSYHSAKIAVGEGSVIGIINQLSEAEEAAMRYKKTFHVKRKHGSFGDLGAALGFLLGAIQYGVPANIQKNYLLAEFPKGGYWGVYMQQNSGLYGHLKQPIHYCNLMAGTLKELHERVTYRAIRNRILEISERVYGNNRKLLFEIAGCFN